MNRSKTILVSVVCGLFAALSTTPSLVAQRGRLYRVHEVTTTGIRFSTSEYQLGQVDSVGFPDLEIWAGAVNSDSLNLIYWSLPDWRYQLLRRGYARIRSDTSINPFYHQVEDSARTKRLGLWRQLSTSPVQARRGDSAASVVPGTGRPNSATDSMRTSAEGKDEATWVGTLFKFVLGGIALFGGYEVLAYIKDWFRRHRVTLILLGEPASGKSWFWHKLIEPSISERDLEKFDRNADVQSGKGDTMAVGVYTLVPQFVDLPGRQTGEHLSKLIDRRRFRFIRFLLVPQKRIWIIFLAPVGDVGVPEVHRGTDTEWVLDEKYVAEQLGYLALPEGVLASKDTPKPEMVIMCISKFDIFSAFAPQDSQARVAAQRLESDFRNHITRIKRACAAKGVPFDVLLTSARKGWGVEDVQRRIQTALYKRERAK